MKNFKTTALVAAIALCYAFCCAACGTGGKKNAEVFLDGKWNKTGEDENCHFLLDGDNWIFYENNKAVSKGTWVSSVKPDAGVSGTITFTVTQTDSGKGWVNLSSEQKKVKTCTVNFSIDLEGNQITLSEKKLAAADTSGIWNKFEGVYKKGDAGNADGGNKAGTGKTGGSDPASRDGKQPSAGTADGKPVVFYIITGSGTSFKTIKNGTVAETAGRTINDIIDAIKADANGANVAIQFGNGENVLDIGADSARFNSGSGGVWGGIVLSGKIKSSVSPAIDINSVFITSIADISAIDNGGTLVINGGTVAANAVNGYGIRNKGGTLIINGGNISPGGEGVYNENVSGKGGKITVNGGTVQSASGRAINNGSGCTVTINGGTVTSFSSETIYNPGGTVKIDGGTVSGGISSHAIRNTGGGTVTITGGTVITVNSNGKYDAISNDGGGTVTITSPPAVIIGGVSGI